MVTAIEGNLMAKGGRAAQALATAAVGSWVAGTIGTLLLAFFAPIVTRFAISRGPGVFRRHAARLHGRNGGARRFTAAGFISLALGLTIGLVGLDSVSGQARQPSASPTRRRNRHRCGRGGHFALGEALWIAAHLRRRAVEVIPVGRPWMGKSDLKIVETLAPGDRLRVSLRRDTRGRSRNSDLLVLYHREAAHQASGGVR